MSASNTSCQPFSGLVQRRSRFTGKLFPNGEFTLGINTRKGEPLKPIKPYKRRLPMWSNFNEKKYLEIKRGVVNCIGRELSLGLSLPTNSHTHPKPRSKRGSKGINSKQKRRVRNFAWLIQDVAFRRTLSLLTLTVPSLSDEEIAAINKNWAEVVRVFCQWLQRRLVASELSGEYVSVTEIQEKRFRASGQVALHLHVLFQGRRTAFDPWALNPIEVREAWLRSLSKFTDKNLESKSCERLEMVKGNAGAYLAKYMSKGSEIVSAVKDAGLIDQLPSTWVNASKTLKDRLKRSIRVIDDMSFSLIKYMPLFCRMKMVTYIHEFWLPPSQEGLPQTLIGLCGRFITAQHYDIAAEYIRMEERRLIDDSAGIATAA